ncbi:MAG: hypothetical protein H0W50_01960 [Parachlamydiaceae bacterium]|nr:hypothetical protein [Parachlamydiaceae bacterium]
MNSSSTISNKKFFDNDQGWKIPNPKKTCKDRNQDKLNITTENLTPSYSKIENTVQFSFRNGAVQDDSNQGKQVKDQKKQISVIKKGNSDEVIPPQSLIAQIQDAKTAEQARLKLTQECNALKISVQDKADELKRSKTTEVELKSKIEKLTLEIKALQGDLIKASKEAQCKSKLYNEKTVNCEMLKIHLDEKSKELELNEAKELESKLKIKELELQIFSLTQKIQDAKEETRDLSSKSKIDLQMQIDRYDMKTALLAKSYELIDENNAKINKYLSRIVVCEEKLNDNESCKEILHSNLNRAVKRVENLENQIETLLAKTHTKAEMCDKLNTLLDEKRNELEQSKIKEEEFKIIVEDLKSQTSDLSDQVQEAKKKLAETALSLQYKADYAKRVEKLLLEKRHVLEKKEEEYTLSQQLNTQLLEIRDYKIQDLVKQNESIKLKLNGVVENLKNKENELKVFQDKKIEDLSKVIKPTSSDLMVTLQKIEKFAKDFSDLMLMTKEVNVSYANNLNKLKEKEVACQKFFEFPLCK